MFQFAFDSNQKEFMNLTSPLPHQSLTSSSWKLPFESESFYTFTINSFLKIFNKRYSWQLFLLISLRLWELINNGENCPTEKYVCIQSKILMWRTTVEYLPLERKVEVWRHNNLLSSHFWSSRSIKLTQSSHLYSQLQRCCEGKNFFSTSQY